MLKRLNILLQRWNATVVSAILVLVAIVMALAAYAVIDVLLFPGDTLEVLIEAAIGTVVVATPLIVLCVATVKSLDRSKERYKRLRDHALAESQAKSRFLANTSHELRTPLNAILGFAQVIEQEAYGPVGDARYAEYAHDIRTSGEHLSGIIEDLLSQARADAGTMELFDEAIDPRSLIEAAVRMVQVRPEAEALHFSVALPEAAPVLVADPRLLRQMVLNLLSNAVKFTPEGGEIAVTAGLLRSGEFEIEVRDTGKGMAREDIPRALEPFGQLDRGKERGDRGLGLGLPLVKAMMELHGGSLRLSSEPGVGTRARLRFPAGRVRPRGSATVADHEESHAAAV